MKSLLLGRVPTTAFKMAIMAGVIGGCLAAGGTPAQAQQSSSELIVRLKKNSKFSFSPSFAPALSGMTLAEPLNATANLSMGSESGLIHLKFNSAQDAADAQAKLAASNLVESVVPDFLYHPAIALRVRDIARSAAQDLMEWSVPFVRRGWDQGSGRSEALPDPQWPTHVETGEDPLASKDWALSKIDMPSVEAVRKLLPSSKKIIAAVIDTGVDYNHEDLMGAMWRNPSNANEVGYDFAHNNNKPFDQRHFDIEGCLKDAACRLGYGSGKFLTNPGHGTHCAGHVGAVANNSIGIRGVGGAVQIMALKFFYDANDENAGAGDDAAAIQSIDYAIQHGAKVISASWGGRELRPDAEKSELKKALIRAQRAGVLVVIAAGNDGIDQDNVEDPDFPAAYTLDNLLVVAASDANDQIADFSNFGARSVHIAAPGVKILSTTTGGTPYNDVVATYKDSKGNTHEMDWDGTSMATPIVAGAAALVWSKYPRENYLQIKNRILRSARHVNALDGKVSTGGVLDVSAALGLN
jgi:subtilisin family serine protease